MSPKKDKRKNELKNLYRKYSDLPNEIIIKIIEHNDAEKRKKMPIPCKKIITEISELNNRIEKIEAELSATTKLRDCIPVKERLYPPFESAHERQIKMDMRHVLQMRKVQLLNKCKWMIFNKKQEAEQQSKQTVAQGCGVPVLRNDMPIGVVQRFDGKIANANLWARYLGAQMKEDGNLAAIEINA